MAGRVTAAVSGGLRWDDASGWTPVDDVIAFDLETRRWMELLAPSEGG